MTRIKTAAIVADRGTQTIAAVRFSVHLAVTAAVCTFSCIPALVHAGGVPGELDEVIVTGYKIGGLAGEVTSERVAEAVRRDES